jgi:hypothetical protein
MDLLLKSGGAYKKLAGRSRVIVAHEAEKIIPAAGAARSVPLSLQKSGKIDSILISGW